MAAVNTSVSTRKARTNASVTRDTRFDQTVAPANPVRPDLLAALFTETWDKLISGKKIKFNEKFQDMLFELCTENVLLLLINGTVLK